MALRTISEVMIRAFSDSWFTFNTLFYFRAFYQIKGVKARFKRRTLHVPNLIYIFRSTQLKLLSSTVDSDDRTLHVPNLIRGEKKYNSYRLKKGNKLKKVNSPSLEILVLILEIHCYADDSQLYLSFRS